MHIVRVMPLQQDAFYRTAMEGLQPGCGRTLAFLGNTAKRCLKGWRYEVQDYPTGTPSVVRNWIYAERSVRGSALICSGVIDRTRMINAYTSTGLIDVISRTKPIPSDPLEMQPVDLGEDLK